MAALVRGELREGDDVAYRYTRRGDPDCDAARGAHRERARVSREASRLAGRRRTRSRTREEISGSSRVDRPGGGGRRRRPDVDAARRAIYAAKRAGAIAMLGTPEEESDAPARSGARRQDDAAPGCRVTRAERATAAPSSGRGGRRHSALEAAYSTAVVKSPPRRHVRDRRSRSAPRKARRGARTGHHLGVVEAADRPAPSALRRVLGARDADREGAERWLPAGTLSAAAARPGAFSWGKGGGGGADGVLAVDEPVSGMRTTDEEWACCDGVSTTTPGAFLSLIPARSTPRPERGYHGSAGVALPSVISVGDRHRRPGPARASGSRAVVHH